MKYDREMKVPTTTNSGKSLIVDEDKVFSLRQDQLKEWDKEATWRGWLVLAVVCSLGLFLL